MARGLLWTGVAGLVSAPVMFVLTFFGILPEIVGLGALLLVPAGGAAIYVGATAELPAKESTPSLMQVYAGGGPS
jgi:hypothetical protein